MTAAGYVGIEPEAGLWLAASIERAGDDVRATGARLRDLLAEAGEPADTVLALTGIEHGLRGRAADVRRRVALASFDAAVGASASGVGGVAGLDTLCVVPWYDPLVRAGRAIRANAYNAGAGAGNSVVEGATAVWQLVPGVDGWQQSWVDTAVGLREAVRHPTQAVRAIVNEEDYDERGFSYWAGGFVPDVAFYFLGGAGAVKTATKVADAAGDVGAMARANSRLQRATEYLPRRNRGDLTDVPVSERPVPRRRLLEERRSRSEVVAIDVETGGHHASRHGAGTTLPQQEVRAKTGTTPDGRRSRPQNGSRFFRWEDQAEAIRRAQVLHADPAVKDKLRITVEMDHPVGEGYMTGTLEYRRTATVVVRFNDAGVPYTSFPELSKGWAQ